ncbi:MAG: hypothetical protein Tp167SUR398091_26 [Prokaryotic dsDNA virus sp.]|jgi:hypothetical protein|nr:MAG: hypothetical protein Tp167SUR398091_26 [Prokaryotic dsDNA virus sp.]|tara:strand:- start:4480 stop:4848 length:369 start_codon:yes stop_codon:yes gene_type:complete
MTEYDNTDTGAAFTPFTTQRLILQGKINSGGTDMKVTCVMDETKDGKQIIEIYQKVGVLFQNEGMKEGAPDYTGPLFDDKRLAAWKKMKDEKPYMSFSVSDKLDKGQYTEGKSSIGEDKIPF